MSYYKPFAVFVWAAAVAAGLSSVERTSAMAQSPVPTGLQDARRALTAAVQTGDKAAFARLLADEMTWISSSGRLQDKASRVAGLESDPSTQPEPEVRTYPGGAVLIGTRNGAIRYQQLWVQRGAQWRLAAHQATSIAGAGSPAPAPASASPSSAPPATLGPPADIAAIEESWNGLIGAIRQGDADGFRRRVTDQMRFVGPDGAVKDKEQRAREIAGRPRRDVTNRRDEISTRVYGDVAVTTVRSIPAAGPAVRQTMFYVRQQGRWINAGSIMTALPQSSAPSSEALEIETAWAAARKAGTSTAMTSKDFFNVTPAGRIRLYADLNETPAPDYQERDCTGRIYGTAAVVVCTQRGGGGGGTAASNTTGASVAPARNRRPAESTEERFLRVFAPEGSQWKAVLSHGVWIVPQAPQPAALADPLPSVRAYTPKDATEKDLLAVNAALTEAFAKGEAAAYGRHTAPEFTSINPAGAVADRRAYLETVAGVKNRRPSLQDEMRIRVYGDVAVLAWKNIPVSADSKAGSATRMSRVYAKRDGAWQQVVTISTPTAPATGQ